MFPTETGHANGSWPENQVMSMPGQVCQFSSSEGKEVKLHVDKSDSDSIAQ